MPLEVHIVSPEDEVFAGEAEMVVAKGTDGDVGIMAGHAPMLVALARHPVRVIQSAGERRFEVDGGFLHVSTEEGATRVDVLADDARPEGEGLPS